MPTFALERLDLMCRTVEVSALMIDGKSEYQQFWADHRKDNFTGMLHKLETRLREVAELKRLPKAKWRKLTPETQGVAEFEAKADDLRMYCLKIPNKGYVIVTVGFKGEQNKDIARMRSIKTRYLQELSDIEVAENKSKRNLPKS